VARAWSVDERIVRRVLLGEAPLTHERIASLPREARRAYLTAQLASLDDSAPVSLAPVEQQALRATAAVGELAETVTEALSDGFCDPQERDQIAAAALRGESACRVVRLSAHAQRARAAGQR
jgi:hypothetical protein